MISRIFCFFFLQFLNNDDFPISILFNHDYYRIIILAITGPKANRLLGTAMDPSRSGLHPGLFDDSLLGVAFYTVLEAGIIVSGNVGTGIVMARNPTNGAWSAPAAVGLSGIGWGLMGGANMKSLLYLIYDYYTLDAMSGDSGVMLGSQAGASLGSWGRTAEAAAIMSAKGRGTNIALAYSHGIFVGLSVEGALSKGRTRVNERFYGRRVTTAEILFSGGKLDIPDGTLLPELYTKLQRLCEGLPVYETTEEERLKVEANLRMVAKEEEEARKNGLSPESSLIDLMAKCDSHDDNDKTGQPTTADLLRALEAGTGDGQEGIPPTESNDDDSSEEEEAIECYLTNLDMAAATDNTSVSTTSSSSFSNSGRQQGRD
jgi:lipid-binding SYLF domain-containing protein